MEALGVWGGGGDCGAGGGGDEGCGGLEGYSYMFEVGICRNRFGAAWAGAKLLLLTITISSFSLTLCVPQRHSLPCESPAPSFHHPTGEKILIIPVPLIIQFNHPSRLMGFIVSTDDDYQKRMVMLVPVDDRAGWFVEFWDLERVKVFKRVVRGRMGGEMERVEGRGDITLEVLGNGV
ncbi:hypothetical protein BC829DRAFT_384094 [Chytridium lagenaria]|nr:hypothetical protein BC829DRAFT_384094 [Chytridium lagenaria]